MRLRRRVPRRSKACGSETIFPTSSHSDIQPPATLIKVTRDVSHLETDTGHRRIPHTPLEDHPVEHRAAVHLTLCGRSFARGDSDYIPGRESVVRHRRTTYRVSLNLRARGDKGRIAIYGQTKSRNSQELCKITASRRLLVRDTTCASVLHNILIRMDLATLVGGSKMHREWSSALKWDNNPAPSDACLAEEKLRGKRKHSQQRNPPCCPFFGEGERIAPRARGTVALPAPRPSLARCSRRSTARAASMTSFARMPFPDFSCVHGER